MEHTLEYYKARVEALELELQKKETKLNEAIVLLRHLQTVLETKKG